jgi:hypothetical protein
MQLHSTLTKLAVALALVVLTAPVVSAADCDNKAQKHQCKIVNMIKHLFGASAGSTGTTTSTDDAPSLNYPPSEFIITP